MSFSVAYSFYLNQKNAEDHHDKKVRLSFVLIFSNDMWSMLMEKRLDYLRTTLVRLFSTLINLNGVE